MCFDIAKRPCGGRRDKSNCCKVWTLTPMDTFEFESSQNLNDLPKVTEVPSGGQRFKLPSSWPHSTCSFLHGSLCLRPGAWTPPSLTLVPSHTLRCVLITQQCKTLYVVCYFISRNMVHSLHYIKQLCVYLGSKCYLVVSSMGYFVSSITFLSSLSICLLNPTWRNGALHSSG